MLYLQECLSSWHQEVLIWYLTQCVWSMYRLLDTLPLYLCYELLLVLTNYAQLLLYIPMQYTCIVNIIFVHFCCLLYRWNQKYNFLFVFEHPYIILLAKLFYRLFETVFVQLTKLIYTQFNLSKYNSWSRVP